MVGRDANLGANCVLLPPVSMRELCRNSIPNGMTMTRAHSASGLGVLQRCQPRDWGGRCPPPHRQACFL